MYSLVIPIMKVLKALKLKTKSNKKPRVCAMKHAVGAELLWRPSSFLKHKLKYAMLRRYDSNISRVAK